MEILNFNEKGYLQPANVQIVSEETLKHYFCTNEIRQILYEKYLGLIDNLMQILEVPFYVWLNGSFISLNPNPKDIDMVVFIDFAEKEQKDKALSKLKNTLGIDLYFVKTYPENHKQNTFMEMDKLEWTFLFVTDRQRNDKGFIQINYENGK